MVVALEMDWRHLLFENWPVDPALLRPHVPDVLDLDTHDGKAWLSVVPFVNGAIRPRGLPRWVGLSLPEINVRTYVTYQGKPAVYFFSLDAQGVAGVLGARLFHHLPYYYARISLSVEDGGVRFRSHRRHPGARPATYEATYRPTGEPFSAPEKPLAAFLVERYGFYAEDLDGNLRFTAVEHDPWTLYSAEPRITENTLLGAERFDRPDADPVSYYSPGLEVTASSSERADGRQ
ncbi:YqjF family protein [Saliphagus infecundisoli]|uniref:YqjF family protein n=1 Tax=Saliphagus infecundisoli TaxID=1849069 RepID=A0ABD5QGU2_9EURY|nr:DUF2071 domain-containing protein [Saliphagus infecundisoli]